MKKNGYYIYCQQTSNGTPLPGVIEKIDLQNSLFSNCFDMYNITLQYKTNKLAKRLLPGSQLFYWNEAFKQLREPAFIYIRKPWADSGMVDFLRQVRSKYPKTIIIIEIPTYPYDKEYFSNPINYTLFLKDYLSRRQFPQYVDRIVTYSRDDRIFGVKTIPIMNGIDVGSIKPREPKAVSDEIRLLAVASFQSSHGYERVIRGLSEYYSSGGKRKIFIDFVGGGETLEEYRQLTKELGLTKHIVFHGLKYGDEKRPFYDNADIGLGVFGGYKNNIFLSSALKTREYLAYGLPIASGINEDIFQKSPSPYFIRYRNCPEPTDINRLIKFYDRCYKSGKSYKQVIEDIYGYAERNADIKTTFEPVIRYILKTVDKRNSYKATTHAK